MRKIIAFTFFYVVATLVVGQFNFSASPMAGEEEKPLAAEDLTTWQFTLSEGSYKVGDEVDLFLTATITDTWYVYGNDFDCPPIKTELKLDENASFSLVGGLTEVAAAKKFDDIFGCEYTYFKKKAKFKQRIKLLAEKVNISGVRSYQVCSLESGLCLMGEAPVSLSFTALPATKIETPKVVKTPPIETSEKAVEEVKPSEEKDTSVASSMPVDSSTAVVANAPVAAGDCPEFEIIHYSNEVLTTESLADYAWFMVLAFLSGLAALLTPCVFPMIPMTVTFFTKSGSNRKKGISQALIYGFSIILIYVVFGTVVALINGPGFANLLSTHWLPNVLFFVVFLVFAMSFLGMFEITLPNKFINSVDAQADKGGLIGVFFMAFTLVLVSFSCTGPIVGTILVEAAGGQVLKPILGMFAFASAFAIPFTLFAIFPSWLSGLPQSGGWLNSVKVVLGFLELALAFKFLSVADQAYHWGLLDREVVLVIWIAIGLALFLYLIGKLILPHDSKMEKVGVPRFLLALVVLSFTIYMIPGLFGAPLKSLSGLLPPMSTQDFVLGKPSHSQSGSNLCDKPLYADRLHLPHGLDGYFDLCQAVQCAREQQKPIFVDFTGHGCVNCRKMEQQVWAEPQVLALLREDFIMTALYVDDKIIELPAEKQYTNAQGKKIENVGDYNFDFQLQHFNQQAQPYYVILEVDEMLSTPEKVVLRELQSPVTYVSTEVFESFLKEGLAVFNKK